MKYCLMQKICLQHILSQAAVILWLKNKTLRLYELLDKNGVECELANYGEEYGKSLAHVFSVLEPFDKAGKDAIDGALNFFEENMKNKVNS